MADKKVTNKIDEMSDEEALQYLLDNPEALNQLEKELEWGQSRIQVDSKKSIPNFSSRPDIANRVSRELEKGERLKERKQEEGAWEGVKQIASGLAEGAVTGGAGLLDIGASVGNAGSSALHYIAPDTFDEKYIPVGVFSQGVKDWMHEAGLTADRPEKGSRYESMREWSEILAPSLPLGKIVKGGKLAVKALPKLSPVAHIILSKMTRNVPKDLSSLKKASLNLGSQVLKGGRYLAEEGATGLGAYGASQLAPEESPLVQVILGAVGGGASRGLYGVGSQGLKHSYYNSKRLPGGQKAGEEAMKNKAADLFVKDYNDPDLETKLLKATEENKESSLPLTTPEATRNPGGTKLLRRLRTTDEYGVKALDFDDARNQRLTEEYNKAVDGGALDPSVAGEEIRKVAIEERAKQDKKIKRAYKDIDPEGTILVDMEPASNKFREKIKGWGTHRDVTKTEEVRSSIKSITKDIEEGVPLDFNSLNGLRRRVNSASRVSDLSPTEKTVISMAKEALNEAEEVAMKSKKGLTEPQLLKWKEARELRRIRGRDFDEQFGSDLLKSKQGEWSLADEKIISKALKTKAGMARAKDIFREREDGLLALRRGVLGEIRNKSVDHLGNFSPAKYLGAMKANKEVLGELFSEPHLKRLKLIEDRLQKKYEEPRLAKIGSEGESSTAGKLEGIKEHNRTLDSVISFASGGASDAISLSLIAGKALTKALSKKNKKELTRILWEASLDPKVAYELTLRAKKNKPRPLSEHSIEVLRKVAKITGIEEGKKIEDVNGELEGLGERFLSYF